MNQRMPVYILAGGRSRRFGSDKARALLNGRPLIGRLADQLRPVASVLHAVADVPDKYADLGLATLGDRTPGQGPLGGLLTALEHLASENAGPWLLLAACDWVEIRPHWIASLNAARHGSMRVEAVAFRDSRWQPVPALYQVGLLPRVRRHLEMGDRSMQSLLTQARSHSLPLPADWPDVPQINTAEQHRKMIETVEP